MWIAFSAPGPIRNFLHSILSETFRFNHGHSSPPCRGNEGSIFFPLSNSREVGRYIPSVLNFLISAGSMEVGATIQLYRPPYLLEPNIELDLDRRLPVFLVIQGFRMTLYTKLRVEPYGRSLDAGRVTLIFPATIYWSVHVYFFCFLTTLVREGLIQTYKVCSVISDFKQDSYRHTYHSERVESPQNLFFFVCAVDYWLRSECLYTYTSEPRFGFWISARLLYFVVVWFYLTYRCKTLT